MQTWKGTYSFDSPDNVRPAVITATNKRIEIHLKDADGNSRIVYWYWPDVVKGKETYGGCILHYPGLPLQTLQVADNDFAAFAEMRIGKKKRSIPAVVTAVAGVGVFILALLLTLYFWLIPWLAGRVADSMPISYEVKFGDDAYNAMIGSYKVLPEETRLVSEFYQAMHITSSYPVRITVVEEKQANAFAVPGGHIVVFSGLLKQMQHPEELAALLAHEYSHVALRHTTRSIMQGLATYMAVSLVFGDLTGVGAVIVENANMLRGLQYSRKLEREADMNGLALLEKEHIDGQGYILLFETLKKSTASGPSEWLSSHPDLDNRIAYIRKQLSSGPPPVPSDAFSHIWEQLKALFVK